MFPYDKYEGILITKYEGILITKYEGILITNVFLWQIWGDFNL